MLKEQPVSVTSNHKEAAADQLGGRVSPAREEKVARHVKKQVNNLNIKSELKSDANRSPRYPHVANIG